MVTRKTPNLRLYKLFRHEFYGMAGLYGHKVWVEFKSSTSLDETSVTNMVKEKYGQKKVVLGGHEFDPTEITIFIYFNRRPFTAQDNWIADKVIEVELV